MYLSTQTAFAMNLKKKTYSRKLGSTPFLPIFDHLGRVQPRQEESSDLPSLAGNELQNHNM